MIITTLLVVIVIVLALGFLGFFFNGINDDATPRIRLLGISLPSTTWLRYRQMPTISYRTLTTAWSRLQWGAITEVCAIFLWAFWVGRTYLDFSPTMWPAGSDFPLTIQGHTVWTMLGKCGACVLWNGGINGGNPAFADYHGAPLHPLVIITTLLWGVVNGAKVTIILSLALAGVAQWWLAKVLGLGRVARVWSAAMAVIGGHLAGRMELGMSGMVLSTSAGSLVIAPLIDLARTGRRRSAVLLGGMVALTLMSAQAYIQLALFFGLFPAALILLFDDKLRLNPVWKEFALAGGLALALSAVLLIPLAHFWPHITKNISPDFTGIQPIQYAPLNLVINDLAYYQSEILQKYSLPAFTMYFIGWVPVLLALAALRLIPRSERKLLAFLLTAIVLIYAASAALPFKLLKSVLRDEVITIRFATLMAGLAIPLLLGLAAWGLDRLLRMNWPNLMLTLPSGRGLGLKLSWICVTLFLGWGLKACYDFNQPWLRMLPTPTEIPDTVAALASNQTRWVRPPDGDFVFVLAATEAGTKLTQAYRAWGWKDNQPPPFAVNATRKPEDAPTSTIIAKVDDNVTLINQPDVSYAYVDTGSKQIPCSATATGGSIDVACQTSEAGTLVVQENAWTGWFVWRDDSLVERNAIQWLSTSAPAGSHHFAFRYLPWDVPLGALLTLLGIVLSVIFWVRTPRTSSPDYEEPLVSEPLQLASSSSDLT